jgi:hypothetical protein
MVGFIREGYTAYRGWRGLVGPCLRLILVSVLDRPGPGRVQRDCSSAFPQKLLKGA